MNWQKHVSNFNRLCAEKGISIREYAEYYHLNPNTARRYLRSAHSAPSDDHGAKRDQTHPPKKHRPEAGQSAESHARPSPRPSTKRRQTDTDAPSSPVKSADSRNAKLIMPPEVIMTHQKLPRGEGRRLPVGNETAMKHGRYATPRQADVD